MKTTRSIFTKTLLAALVLAITFAALPMVSTSAASEEQASQPSSQQAVRPVRLQRAWDRAQRVFHRQGRLLGMADEFALKLQERLDKASTKGWDTSAVQAALVAFEGVLPAARTAHGNGTAILAAHTGFDADGLVTDQPQAAATLKALNQVIKETHQALGGTGKALRQAIQAMRAANQPKP